MRVLHLAYADGGGGAFKAAYRIHRGLRDSGVDSRMLVSKRTTADPAVSDAGTAGGRLWGQVTTYLDLLPWKILGVPRREFSSLAWAGTGVSQRVRRAEPDIVQLHWVCAGFLRLEALAGLNYPIVWRAADLWPLAGAEHYVGDDTRFRDGYRRDLRPGDERGPDLNRWTWERKRRVYARIRNLTLVAPSRWLGRCARESVLFKDRRVEVIPTGQDLEAFRPMPKAAAREILGLPRDARLVMAASMDLGDRRKGVEHLLSAMDGLRGRQFHLLLLGEPGSAARVPAETHWLGRLNDDVSLALAYSAADVFVCPSIEENLANTVIEAMACGIPCVAFNIGGMPDIIRPRRNGYLATPFDAADLAAGIASILDCDPASYSALSAEARVTVEQEFSEVRQASRYAALYEELLDASLANRARQHGVGSASLR